MASHAEPASAAQRVYEWLRTRILDGTYAGGTLLSEGEIAEAVRTSRTPVREAFLQLAAQEMLALYPKRGALVLSVSTSELRDVLAARALIEPWAAALVARRPDRADVITELRRLTDQATQAFAAGNDTGFQEADRSFHHCLLSATGNRLLATFYSSLRDRQLRSGTLAMHNRPDRGTQTMAQHGEIADAIEAGDPDRAAAAATTHVHDTALALGLSSLV
jgi:DNA-binding GntR family transcriptional regulator